MKVWVAIFAAIILVAGTASWWLLQSPNFESGAVFLNPAGKASPVPYDAQDAGFEGVVSGLFKRPLVELDSDSARGRFTRVTDSGVKFSNYYSRSKPNRFMETGSGVAIGDYDNDGLQDIYLCGSEIPNKLYRNLGDFKFEDVTKSAGVEGRFLTINQFASGATFADIDNDGFLDLFVCNMGGPNLLYSNQGDGTFVEQAELRNVNYSGGSKIGSFCDYDRDGDLDMYLLTYRDFQAREAAEKVTVDGVEQIKPGQEEFYDVLLGNAIFAGEKDILYRNDGNGVFEDVSKVAGIEEYDLGLGVLWSDFDGDGWQDIYVSSDYRKQDHLYRNQGDGTFKDVLPEVVKRTPWFSMGVDSGDINNDGFIDMMVGDMAGRTHFKQKVDMGGMDDASWFLAQGEPRQLMKNCLFVNSGTGSFFEAASIAGLAATNWTWAIRFVDMDNDGLLDLYATTGHARDSMNADLNNRMAEQGATSGVQGMQAYAAIPARKEVNLAFKNQFGLKFDNVSSTWALDHKGVSHGASFADLDNDGDLDLVVNNYYEESLVYRNDLASAGGVVFEFRCRDNNYFGVGTKVEIWQDGQYQMRTLTPTRGYISSDPLQVHFGTRSESLIERAVVTWPDGKVQEFADLKVNNCYRVLENSGRGEKVMPNSKPLFADVAGKVGIDFCHTETPFDDFSREPLLPYKLSELGSGIAWGDVNKDGRPDLFCGGAAGQSAELYINNDGQSFSKVVGPWSDDSSCEDMGVLFFDSDNDGDQDLYVVSGGNEFEADSTQLQDRLYLNDGSGKFFKSKDALPAFNASGSCVTAVDFDHDGDLDLFVGSRSIPANYPETPTSYLLQNDGGKFTDVTDSTAVGLRQVGLVNSAVWSDTNGDGWPDLVLALDWGPVTVFQNRDGRLADATAGLGLDKTLGWWHGIAAADLDDDGDLDYVVTNHGTNTKYHADEAHPHRLYYEDFDDNGTIDLVEAEYENGVEVPIRGRSCSSRTMPFIANKYAKYKDFALASIPEIYDTNDQTSQFRQVNHLESSVLWNDGGKFRIEKLPRLAQISPAFGVAVADFDGDTHQDIYMANNFFASQLETGRMDGGLSCLLLGHAKNESSNSQFDFSWPKESGVSIPEPAYSVALADFDGDGDIDVATGINDGKLRLLSNQSQSFDENAGLRLELPKDSAPFVGAQLRIVGAGFERLIELNSGSSYLSQSFQQSISIPKSVLAKIQRIQIRKQGKAFQDVPFRSGGTVALGAESDE